MDDATKLVGSLKEKFSAIEQKSKAKDVQIKELKQQLEEAKKELPASPKLEVEIHDTRLEEFNQGVSELGTNLSKTITQSTTEQTKVLKEEIAKERQLDIKNPVKEVRVSNFPVFPKPVFKIPDIFKIEKPDWLDFSPITKTIDDLVQTVKSFAWPKDPTDPIAVRFSDGEKFIEDLVKVVQTGGGGGASVPRYSGKDGRDYVPTVSTLSLPQFDYVSMALSAADTTETYTFRVAGSTGTVVATVVVVYTTSGRTVISTVTKTPIT